MLLRRLAVLFTAVTMLAVTSRALAQPTYKSSPFYGIQLERDYRQTSAEGPAPVPANPAIFYAFLLPNTVGSVRHPSGTTTVIPINNPLFREFPSFAALDAAYPPGTYTLTAGSASGISLSFPANPFPAEVPQVVGGTWNSAGQFVVNRESDVTITINAFADYGKAGVDTNLSIEIFNETGVVILGRNQYSSDVPGLFTTFTIPAGVLESGKSYSCNVSFGILHSTNTTAISGATAGAFVNNYLEFSLSVITAGPGTTVIASQPASQTIAPGSTVVFSIAADGVPAPSYQWRRGTTALAGETRSTLLLSGAAASAGSYNCIVSNPGGTVTSADAILTVNTVAATAVGRLVNLSVLAPTGPGPQLLTMGATVGGPGASGPLALVIRGVGPTLGGAPFNVEGPLQDPVMAIFPLGNETASKTNDDWGGTSALVDAFSSVGAFALPVASRDSAALQDQTAGGFTVQVAGAGSTSGTVIAEVYDAAGATRTATTPHLINLSTLTSIAPAGTLAAGFVIGGSTARTVLVRAVGPTLGTAFGIGDAMTDPKLELFNNNTGVMIAGNDNWNGAAWLLSTNSAVGAFPLGGLATKDAALVITLAPGPYSARVSGVNGAGGTAIIEVYEVP